MMLDVKQITSAVSPDWIGNEYSSVCGFNCDATRLLLVANDHFTLVDTLTGSRTELIIGASQEPRWDMSDPEVLFLVSGNKLVKYNVISGRTDLVREFPEYAAIYGKGEGDISEDGNHFALCGDNSSCFTYDMMKDKKSSAVREWDKFHIDSLVITPENSVLISDVRGTALWDKDMRFMKWVTPTNGHKDCGRDVNGEEIMVWTSNADNHVYKIRLADREPFASKVSLLALDWSLAVDISCPDKVGWALVSTYGAAPVGQYASQVLKVHFGGAVDVLCDHGSVQIPKSGGGIEYNPQPKASVSRDGSMFVFSSNMGDVSNPNYINAYLGKLAAPVVAATPPQPKPIAAGEYRLLDYGPFEGREFRLEQDFIARGGVLVATSSKMYEKV